MPERAIDDAARDAAVTAANDILAVCPHRESVQRARRLYASDNALARCTATCLFGRLAAERADCLNWLRTRVSRDRHPWVQALLAEAFDRCCHDVGDARALTLIQEWLVDPSPGVVRAVSEAQRVKLRGRTERQAAAVAGPTDVRDGAGAGSHNGSLRPASALRWQAHASGKPGH